MNNSSYDLRTYCLEYQGHLNANGYGLLCLDGKQYLAHRLAYLIYLGDIPEGMCVCPTCDNPRCISIEHLFLGTKRDNARDMDAKGRRVTKPQPGEMNGSSKVTTEDVLAIRRARRAGETLKVIAQRHGISITQVKDIATGRKWAHVTDEPPVPSKPIKIRSNVTLLTHGGESGLRFLGQLLRERHLECVERVV